MVEVEALLDDEAMEVAETEILKKKNREIIMVISKKYVHQNSKNSVKSICVPELVNVSGLGMDFLVITLVSLVLSMELEPILNMDPRPRKSFEFRFFFRSSFC